MCKEARIWILTSRNKKMTMRPSIQKRVETTGPRSIDLDMPTIKIQFLCKDLAKESLLKVEPINRSI